MTCVVVKARRLAAQNSHWRVYYDHLGDASGNEVLDYLVLEGQRQRPDMVTGVDVLPLLGDKVVLLRTFRHPLGRKLWEAPRGFVDDGEAPTEAALRELTEETGLSCAPDDLVALGSYAPEPATIAACPQQFAAMRCTGTPRQPQDELGLGALGLFDRNEIAELIAAGEIVHAGTLLLYYRFCELQR